MGARRWIAVLLLAVSAAGCAPKRIFLDDQGAAGIGTRAVALAKEQLGAPYAFGGSQPEVGFDCSGLVQWVYGRCGVPLPRSVDELAQSGRPIDDAEVEPGDLVFFVLGSHDGPDHVGIYTEKHRFVHAPRTGTVVRTESLDDAWWRRRWTSSRRVN